MENPSAIILLVCMVVVTRCQMNFMTSKCITDYRLDLASRREMVGIILQIALIMVCGEKKCNVLSALMDMPYLKIKMIILQAPVNNVQNSLLIAQNAITD